MSPDQITAAITASEDALRRGRIGTSQHALLAVLCTHADAQGRFVATARQIGAWAGLRDRITYRHLVALEDAGLLECGHERGGAAAMGQSYRVIAGTEAR